METIAFRMKLKPGAEEAYKQRHDEIWPELIDVLHRAGVSDYTIFLDPDTSVLFAVLTRTDEHGMKDLPFDPVVQRWWAYIAPLMETNVDKSPATCDLRPVFYMR